jgi:hypothetical protein
MKNILGVAIPGRQWLRFSDHGNTRIVGPQCDGSGSKGRREAAQPWIAAATISPIEMHIEPTTIASATFL